MTRGADISLPPKGRGLLHGDPRLYIRWENAVPVGLRLLVKDLPRRHRHYARANAFAEQVLVGLYREANFTTRYHFTGLKRESFTWGQRHHSHGNCDLGTEAEAKMVLCQNTVRNQCRRFAKLADNFGAGYGQTFAGPNVERNSFPAPGINLQFQSGEGFGLRVLGYSVLIAIAAELAAHKVLLLDGRNCFQHFHFLVAHGLAVGSDRRLHRQIRQHLKKVVLDHITNGSGLIVETHAALYA